LHHCDTPTCVRQSHLWIGSGDDNIQDRHRKGRDNTAPKPPEHRAKISVALAAHTTKPEVRAERSARAKRQWANGHGRHVSSPETRAAMRAAQLAAWAEGRRSRVVSPEQRAKISATLKARSRKTGRRP
jgi:hypothetical protein